MMQAQAHIRTWQASQITLAASRLVNKGKSATCLPAAFVNATARPPWMEARHCALLQGSQERQGSRELQTQLHTHMLAVNAQENFCH